MPRRPLSVLRLENAGRLQSGPEVVVFETVLQFREVDVLDGEILLDGLEKL